MPRGPGNRRKQRHRQSAQVVRLHSPLWLLAVRTARVEWIQAYRDSPAHGRPVLGHHFHGRAVIGGQRELAMVPGRSRPSVLSCAWPAAGFFGDDVHEPHRLDLTNVASQPVHVALTGPHLHWPPVHKQSDNRHRLIGTRRESAESGQPTHLPKVPLTSECRNTRGGGIDVAFDREGRCRDGD